MRVRVRSRPSLTRTHTRSHTHTHTHTHTQTAGLGYCTLAWSGERYSVLPGEGGHASFAPRGARQRALAASLEARDGYCEVESVLCGKGIVSIYEHLKEELGESEEPLPVRTPAEVTGAALDGSCRVCLEVRGGRVCVCVCVCARARACVHADTHTDAQTHTHARARTGG